jgi:hypothetical protein
MMTKSKPSLVSVPSILTLFTPSGGTCRHFYNYLSNMLLAMGGPMISERAITYNRVGEAGYHLSLSTSRLVLV